MSHPAYQLAYLLFSFLIWFSAGKHQAPSAQGASATFQPSPTVTLQPLNDAQAGIPDDGQWPMASKDFANTRFSSLAQINSQNVNQLKLGWTFSTGVLRGREGAPLVVGDTMYLVTPFPNYLYALDLTKPGAPLKWKYDPHPTAAAQGVACCDLVNRGVAYAHGRMFYNTLDNQTGAVDAATGQERWKVKLGEINKGETITMAPLVVGNKVLVGNSGGEFGVRGWLTALDANTGQFAWRAYSTGPDADCLIGPNFKPYYDQDKGKDLGVSSWPPEHWKIGGGYGLGFCLLRC